MSVLGKIDECGEVFGIRKRGKKVETYEIEYVLPVILTIGYLHFGALQGLYVVFTLAKIATTLFTIFLVNFTILGVTAGAHRLWAHQSYEARWPLRLLLLIMHTTANQNSVSHWSRAHRTHHKHRNTNADPYNPQRCFFFAHVGWKLCRKHPDVLEKGAKIDVSDLYNDPLIEFQHENMNSVENLAMPGEAWHNYHYIFSWDYKTSELGRYWYNNTLDFSNFFAWIGWAYDLKTASPDVVNQRILRTVDGRHEVWGWNDQDVTKEEREATVILAKIS